MSSYLAQWNDKVTELAKSRFNGDRAKATSWLVKNDSKLHALMLAEGNGGNATKAMAYVNSK
ncbi:MAG: hypothetical protein SFX18_08755 [Pirellulales bacterium]|nr:hypothetical protein [Pirellulales bacterium]